MNLHNITVADPDFELRGRPGLDLLALSAIFPSVISSFFTQKTTALSFKREHWPHCDYIFNLYFKMKSSISKCISYFHF